VLVTCEPPGSRTFWNGVFSELSIRPCVTHDYAFGGVTLNRVHHRTGTRFISLMNLDLIDKELTIRDGGTVLSGGQIILPGKRAKMLPTNVSLGGLHIQWSSAEVTEVNAAGVSFRQSPGVERPSFTGAVRVAKGGKVVRKDSASTLIEIEPGFRSVVLSPG
jgi:hypothetical protein